VLVIDLDERQQREMKLLSARDIGRKTGVFILADLASTHIRLIIAPTWAPVPPKVVMSGSVDHVPGSDVPAGYEEVQLLRAERKLLRKEKKSLDHNKRCLLEAMKEYALLPQHGFGQRCCSIPMEWEFHIFQRSKDVLS
jgi:hypothetical protein